MMKGVKGGIGLIIATLLLATSAWASEIGQQAAQAVQLSTYQHYLDNELYTHDGDNRGPNGPEHDPARDNIADILESFGLEVELQPFVWSDAVWYNVVATQVGTEYPEAEYILGAHYDSVSNPGADDDGSGVAGVLEIARVLSQTDVPYTIKYVAFDLEEVGLQGSNAYVADHLDDDIRGMIQLDMIAWNNYGDVLDIRGLHESGPLKDLLADAFYEYGDVINVRVTSETARSDNLPFELAGFLGCLLIENRYPTNPCYHALCDSVDNPDYLDYEYATEITRVIAGFLADPDGVENTCVGDVNGDRAINMIDLAGLLSNYGPDSGIGPDYGDFDRDGDVDLSDLATLLAVYDTVCD